MKKIDITDKLSLQEGCALVINGTELEIRTDAATVLKLLGEIQKSGGDGSELDMIKAASELLFTDTALKKLKTMKLNFSDYATVIKSAIEVVTGENTGEAGATGTTT